MKGFLFIILKVLLFLNNCEMSGQEYFIGNSKERCEKKDFKKTLIKAFYSENDSIQYFRNEDIIKVSYISKCDQLQIKDTIIGPPDISTGKLEISYSSANIAMEAYKNLLLKAKHPAHSYFYGFVKGGPMYLCLTKDKIEIYITNYYNPIIIDSKKLEKYLKDNKRKYDNIVIISSELTIIK